MTGRLAARKASASFLTCGMVPVRKGTSILAAGFSRATWPKLPSRCRKSFCMSTMRRADFSISAPMGVVFELGDIGFEFGPSPHAAVVSNWLNDDHAITVRRRKWPFRAVHMAGRWAHTGRAAVHEFRMQRIDIVVYQIGCSHPGPPA